MTFGSGSNGCLGHGNFNDVTQVGYGDVLFNCGILMFAKAS